MYPNYPTTINEAQLAVRWGVGANTMRKKRQDGTMPLPSVQNCPRGTIKYETKDVLEVEAEHGSRPFRSRSMPPATAATPVEPVEPASVPLPALSTPPAPSFAPTDVTAIAELLAEVIEARVTAALDASRRRMIAQLTAP